MVGGVSKLNSLTFNGLDLNGLSLNRNRYISGLTFCGARGSL